MKKTVFLIASIIFLSHCSSTTKDDPDPNNPVKEVPAKLEDIGFSISVFRMTPEKMNYSSSVGITSVEAVSMNSFFDSRGNFTKSDAEARKIMTDAKNAADAAGINIWSIHMAYSEFMDLSTINETDREMVVNGHIKLLEYLAILEPEVVLFHPSYNIDPPGQRDMRKSQLIKSSKELDVAVREIGAVMVLENMLGPELMNGNRERALMRTVEETVEIFNRLPKTIELAIDLNHIKNPENLIRAMGKRLKTLHVADGTGRAENHWFPCSGEGQNDWVEILSALDEVGYKGPWMYECAFPDEKDLVPCYDKLYEDYIKSKYSN